MPSSANRPHREPEVFAPDPRPGADTYVYCKGCGKPLEGRARLAKPRAIVDSMMCEPCQKKHGHPLMPAPGSATFCYRCGGREDIFEAPGTSPAIHHLCSRCLPERAARYRAGDFEPPKPVVEEQPSDGKQTDGKQTDGKQATAKPAAAKATPAT